VTITSLGENNVSGEVVQFTVNEVVDNPAIAQIKRGTQFAIRRRSGDPSHCSLRLWSHRGR
jgi:hypothetical protein